MQALAPKIKKCKGFFEDNDVFMTLSGLQGCGNSEQMEDLLFVLGRKIAVSNVELSSKSIGALGALQWMQDSPGVRKVLAAVVPKLQKSSVVVSGKDFSDAIRGLRSLWECEPVRRLVRALVPRLAKESGMSGLDICNAVVGLEEMVSSPIGAEVLGLLRADAQKVEDGWTAHGIVQAAHSLQHGEESEEVQEMVSVLAARTAKATGNICAQDFGFALQGLAMLGDTGPVQALLKALLGRSVGKQGMFEWVSLDELSVAYQTSLPLWKPRSAFMLPGVMRMDALEIAFSKSTVRRVFDDGAGLVDTAAAILDGRLSLSDKDFALPVYQPIENGPYYTLSNRKLAVIRLAALAQLAWRTGRRVTVRARIVDDREAEEWGWGRKWTTGPSQVQAVSKRFFFRVGNVLSLHFHSILSLSLSRGPIRDGAAFVE